MTIRTSKIKHKHFRHVYGTAAVLEDLERRGVIRLVTRRQADAKRMSFDDFRKAHSLAIKKDRS